MHPGLEVLRGGFSDLGYRLGGPPPCNSGIIGIYRTLIVNASARPPRLAGLPTVGTCNYRYTGI